MILENTFFITSSSYNSLYYYPGCKYISGLRGVSIRDVYVQSKEQDPTSELSAEKMDFLKKRKPNLWVKQSTDSAARRVTTRRLNTAVLILIKGEPEGSGDLAWAWNHKYDA